MGIKKVSSLLLASILLNDQQVVSVEQTTDKRSSLISQTLSSQYLEQRTIMLLDEITKNQQLANIALKDSDKPAARTIATEIHQQMTEVAQDIRYNLFDANNKSASVWAQSFAQKVPEVQQLEQKLDIINDLDPVMDGILSRFSQLEESPEQPFQGMVQKESLTDLDFDSFIKKHEQQKSQEEASEDSIQNAITQTMFQIKSDHQNHFAQNHFAQPAPSLIQTVKEKDITPTITQQPKQQQQPVTIEQVKQAIAQKVNQLQGKPNEVPKLAENRPEIMNSIDDAAQKILSQMNSQQQDSQQSMNKTISAPVKLISNNLTKPASAQNLIQNQEDLRVSKATNDSKVAQKKAEVSNLIQNQENLRVSKATNDSKAAQKKAEVSNQKETVSNIFGSLAEHSDKSQSKEMINDDIETMPSFDSNDYFSGLHN